MGRTFSPDIVSIGALGQYFGQNHTLSLALLYTHQLTPTVGVKVQVEALDPFVWGLIVLECRISAHWNVGLARRISNRLPDRRLKVQ